MVFFNMIPSLAPADKPKPKHLAKTLKNRNATQTRKTSKLHRGRKIKLAPKKMRGGFVDGCDTTGLVTEPGLNVPALLKGSESGLNINKTIARIEKGTKN
jgi:hypothetical protein